MRRELVTGYACRRYEQFETSPGTEPAQIMRKNTPLTDIYRLLMTPAETV